MLTPFYRKTRAIGVIILGLLATNGVFWLRLQRGVVLARSKNRGRDDFIVIRDLPSSNPFWMACITPMLEYHLYRCEYYRFSASTMFSSQTYNDRGYKKYNPQVQWLPDNSAVVSFQGSPVFTCKDGWWNGSEAR
jgi:hypothetical protein